MGNLSNKKGYLPIGFKIDDFKVFDRDNKRCTVYCTVCGRLQTLNSANSFITRNNKHGNICSKLVVAQHGGTNNNPVFKRFYSIWCNLRTRTTNPNYEKWHKYGGRGINSDQFRYFVDFYDLMYMSYLEHVIEYGLEETTIERIDVNGNYCVENCEWITWLEQARNKTSLLSFYARDPQGNEYYGKNLKLFCEQHGLNYERAISGIHQGNLSWKSGWFFKKCND